MLTKSRTLQSWLVQWLAIGSFAVLYYSAGRLGQLAAIPPGNVTPIYPPSGLALSAVSLFGYRIWPGILLGEFASSTWAIFDRTSNASVAISITVGLGVGLGATLQALLGHFFIRRAVGNRPILSCASNVFKFVAIEIVCCTISPPVGALSLCLGRFANWSEYGEIWITWWLGDLIGILVVTPFLLALKTSWQSRKSIARPRRSWRQKQWHLAEIALWFTLVWSVSHVTFIEGWTLEYLLVPLMVWAAFRFGQFGASAAIVIVSVITILGIVHGHSSFSSENLNTTLLMLQGFIGAISVETMILSATLAQVREAKQQLIAANETLEYKVKDRTFELVQEIEERKQAQALLHAEQEKSEQLLLNILPEPIATRLKHDRGAIAEHFDEVTILFADLVGFTPLSARLQPLELVNLLNEIFSTFDRLAEKHGLEKIKTIGDAYMVAGGLPVPMPDRAAAIADMALAMQEAVTRFREERGENIQIRIGINTGVVIAGVIGIKKFIYDLWGDAVNVASRMESSGEPGSIQVTRATYEQLKDRYELHERGKIAVKGKGNMTTYWLRGKRSR
ncbi:adenylate/guanylate cyclase domain-containing protein [Zarconia navalis]|nr:adenylate/guanylate cyclase domain-containing protein [Zarconia navalis]